MDSTTYGPSDGHAAPTALDDPIGRTRYDSDSADLCVIKQAAHSSCLLLYRTWRPPTNQRRKKRKNGRKNERENGRRVRSRRPVCAQQRRGSPFFFFPLSRPAPPPANAQALPVRDPGPATPRSARYRSADHRGARRRVRGDGGAAKIRYAYRTSPCERHLEPGARADGLGGGRKRQRAGEMRTGGRGAVTARREVEPRSPLASPRALRSSDRRPVRGAAHIVSL